MRLSAAAAVAIALALLSSACSGDSTSTSCPAGQVTCGGKCVDPTTDRAYCGASGDCAGASAGSACAAGQVCSAGACALSCQPGLVNCNGKCVDPARDPDFCGASGACTGADAGVACGSGRVCANGACATSCPAGQVACSGRCVDPQTDRAFCGVGASCAGGTVCAAGQVCVSGACTATCPAGQYACGGKCVDPATDPNYCGASSACTGGAACGPSTACYQGACEPLCPPGLLVCASQCVNPAVDRTFCGATGSCTGSSAGKTCAAAEACASGVCEVLPNPGEPNDTLGTATPIDLGTPVVASITSAGDKDFYAFTVPAGGATVRFETFDQGGTLCDPVFHGVDTIVEVFDGSGTSLGVWDDTVNKGTCEDFSLSLAEGTAYVLLTGYEPYPFVYTLKVSVP